jgi:hypothetical protein
MKNGMLFLFALSAAAAGWSLDWHMPVTTMRVETTSGSAEDPDEGTLLPSSLRTTVSLRVKEEASPDAFGLTVRGSWKDYYEQSGDYSYVEVEQDGNLRLSEALKLGYTAGVKDLAWGQLDSDGLSKDSLAVKAGTAATLTIVKGTTLDAGLSGRWELGANTARSLQSWVVATSFSTRIGEWLLGARYRGEFRLPLGAESGVTSSAAHTGAVTLEWDPNR